MRIFEVKNNLVKIFYETSDNLFLSGFVMIKDSRESYIGQIMHLESSKHGNVAIAKIIFNVTEDGVITSYSGTIPAINSAISNINSIDFLKLIQGQSPIIIGEFIENNLLVSLDKSLMENKLVICSENQENTDLMIKTLNRQIKNYGKKTVIIDTDGESIFDKDSLVMGDNFRLPINSQIINFIYENGIEYKSARSKAILQETFMEINYYLSSLDEPYIPINKFIDILEKQYNTSKLPELVLLKNVLVKYNEAGIFARNIMEYKNLFDSLLNNQTTVVDISKVDDVFQRETISYIYSVLNEISDDYYVFLKLSNGNSNKKILKQIFSCKNVYTTINCSYLYKYLTELKKISKDLILFAPLLQQQDFASYNTFLTTLDRTEFVVYGQSTQFMPLIIKLSERAKIMSSAPQSVLTPEDAQRMVQKQLKEQQQKYQAEKVKEEAYQQQQQLSQQMLQQQMSQMVYPQMMPLQMPPQIFYPQQPPVYPTLQMFAPNPYMNMQVPYVQSPVAPQPQAYVQQPFMTSPNANIAPQTQNVQTPQSLEQPIKEELSSVFKSIEPQDMPIENIQAPQQQSEIIDVGDIEPSEQLTEQDLDLIQDVDIYENQETELVEDMNEVQNISEEQTEDETYLDEIHPDNSDVISEESSSENIQQEDMKTKYNITEESLKEPDTVPVYPANTGTRQDVVFEKGDLVVHSTFGNGKVEKIINYGSKKLCSVYFEGVGRRLLDPSLSEISKAN